MTRTPSPARGFTLIELMVTLTVVALLTLIAVPSFGNATQVSRERSAVQKLMQDFSWARSAAAAAGSVSSTTLTLNANCTWSTTVNGVADATHSMSSTSLSSLAPSMACASSLPITFTFTPQGFVNNAGTFTYTGQSGQAYKLQILYSGTVLRLNGAQS